MSTESNHIHLRSYSSKEAAAPTMAAESVAFLKTQLEANGKASVILTGGSSPQALYLAWAEQHVDSIDWSNVHWFWGDERNVPHQHKDSNTQVSSQLLSTLPVNPEFVHFWNTQHSPEEALTDMKAVLAKAELPDNEFDLCLLGLGPDGHIASLFPEHKPWEQSERQGVRYISNSPKPPSERFTFSLKRLNRSKLIYLTPFGKSKREVVNRVLNQDESLPASHIKGSRQTVLWTDAV